MLENLTATGTLSNDRTVILDRPVAIPAGRRVTVLFLPDRAQPAVGGESADKVAWDKLMALVADCAVETGIEDLAHRHDHYLYGKGEGMTG